MKDPSTNCSGFMVTVVERGVKIIVFVFVFGLVDRFEDGSSYGNLNHVGEIIGN